MHKHLRNHIDRHIKKQKPVFWLLMLLERFLTKMKKEHDVTDVEELERRLLEEVKEKSKDEHLVSQLELLAITKEVIDAYHIALKAHEGQKRKSGENYVVHPIQACLNEIYHQREESHEFSEETLVSALLHDTVEDTEVGLEDISHRFGSKIEKVIDQLTHNEEWKKWHSDGHLSKLEHSALEFINVSQLDESVSVKFDDRLDNLQTLDSMPDAKQTQKVLDTIAVGYIDKAGEMKEWKFLEVLLDCITRYLSDARIEAHYHRDPMVMKIRDRAVAKIQSLLSQAK